MSLNWKEEKTVMNMDLKTPDTDLKSQPGSAEYQRYLHMMGITSSATLLGTLNLCNGLFASVSV